MLKSQPRFFTLAAALLIALGLAGGAHAEYKAKPKAPVKTQKQTGPSKFYKWVDDEGKVHYTEHLPPEATGKSLTQINRQGAVVKETDRALTTEERRAQDEAAAKREEEMKAYKEEERKNVAVMSSYSSEKDIDFARERALASNADAIKSATHNVEAYAKRKAELEKQKEAYKDKPLPPKLARELESNDSVLRDQQTLLDTKKRDAERINTRYDEDKRRFLRLTKPASTASIAPPTP